MAEALTADSSGNATITRTVHDLNTSDAITLVSCDVTEVNNAAAADPAPTWFTNSGLTQDATTDRLNYTHEAIIDVDAAKAAGVTELKYDIVISDGTFTSNLVVWAVITGGPGHGAVALFFGDGSKLNRLGIPVGSGAPTPFGDILSPRVHIPSFAIEQRVQLYYAALNQFDVQVEYLADPNAGARVGTNSTPENFAFAAAYNPASDQILRSGYISDNEQHKLFSSDVINKTQAFLWANPEGRPMYQFVVDAGNQTLYVRESGPNFSRRDLSNGSLLASLAYLPHEGADSTFYLRGDAGAGKLFAFASDAENNAHRNLWAYDIATNAWTKIMDGTANGIGGNVQYSFDVDHINEVIYFGTQADGIYTINYDGTNLTQIVATTKTWWPSQFSGLCLWVAP